VSTDPKVALERRQNIQDSRVGQLERLWEIRLFEDRVLELFADGKGYGITHTGQGQEAVAVGIATVARPTDLITCTYRGHGIALALGLTPEEVLAELVGRSTGCAGGLGGSMHLTGVGVGMLPQFAVVGSGIPVATGVGLAAKLAEKDDIGIAVFGDGAANIGAFHEGINLAAIWELPVLFVCENNVYGEYTRQELSTPVKDIADRAAAYAIPGHVVDGQDLDTVVSAVRQATETIRDGGGPQLLELKTYRYRGHFHLDPGLFYRPEGEMEEWLARDPVVMFERKLIDEGTLTEEETSDLRSRMELRIDEVVEIVMASPEPDLSTMFAYVYS
jgi:acetoin:2,6-dichlorophenolindophenol oxidoreductase subunit alpha